MIKLAHKNEQDIIGAVELLLLFILGLSNCCMFIVCNARGKKTGASHGMGVDHVANQGNDLSNNLWRFGSNRYSAATVAF